VDSTLISLLAVIIVVTVLAVVSSYQPLSPRWQTLKRWFVRLSVVLLIGAVLLFSWHVIVIAMMNHDSYLGARVGFHSVTLRDNTILHFNPFTNLLSIEFGPEDSRERMQRSAAAEFFLEDALNHNNLKRFDIYAHFIPYRVRLKESGSVVLP